MHARLNAHNPNTSCQWAPCSCAAARGLPPMAVVSTVIDAWPQHEPRVDTSPKTLLSRMMRPRRSKGQESPRTRSTTCSAHIIQPLCSMQSPAATDCPFAGTRRASILGSCIQSSNVKGGESPRIVHFMLNQLRTALWPQSCASSLKPVREQCENSLSVSEVWYVSDLIDQYPLQVGGLSDRN